MWMMRSSIKRAAGSHLGGFCSFGSDRRFMPSFQARKNQILFAGKHVARLRAVELLPDGTCQTISGTAFFFAHNLLLTAAHNVIPRTDGGRIIKIGFAYMGRSIVDCNTPTNECIVTALHYAHKSMSQDIAILKCPRHYAPTFLSLSADPLGKGDVVHVIGYPGEISSDWLKDAHDSLNDLQTSLCRSEVLLPKDTLTVTEGIMESMQDGKLSYRISTSHGMSGSPVLYNGKVHGITIINL